VSALIWQRNVPQNRHLGGNRCEKPYWIETGDLVFNNVFAWEGAMAVARPADHERVGSHCFLTCVPQEGLAKSSFLCFHFLTERGLQQLGEASPGSAGRNRTRNIKLLEKLEVPVPAFEKQVWFDALQSQLDAIKQSRAETQKELDALMPSVLAKAFAGEL
jgi:type I restriction enzyme S subunit